MVANATGSILAFNISFIFLFFMDVTTWKFMIGSTVCMTNLSGVEGTHSTQMLNS